MKNVEAVYPATPVQQGMLFESLYAESSGVYVNQLAYHLAGSDEAALDLAAWRRAWESVIAHHPVLRTAFLWEGLDQVLQVVRTEVEVPWREVDASGWSGEERERRWRELLREDRRRGFDPRQAPLSRFTVLHRGDGTADFLWTHHHLLLDGWSLSLVLEEVRTVYRALVAGRFPPVPAAPPFENYVAWLAGRDEEADAGFWSRYLAGITAPTPLGVDRLPPLPGGDGAGGNGDREPQGDAHTWLDEEATRCVEELCRRTGVSPGTLGNALWGLLLARYSGEDEVLFGTVVSGRPSELPGIESMVGMFINTLPLRLEVEPRRRLAPWLLEVQETVLALRDHEHAAPAQVQKHSGVPTGTPLYESLLAFQSHGGRDAGAGAAGDGGGLLTARPTLARESTGYPLTVQLVPGRRLGIQVIHERHRIDDATALRLLGHLKTVLTTLVAEGGEGPRLGEIPLTSSAERQAVLVDWNDTGRDWSLDTTLDALIAEQARRTPEADAVASEAGTWSYRELDRRTALVARHLRRLGVGPGTVVGVHLERSRGLLAALVAILRAGGAYLPLDPDHPPQRRRDLLADAGAPVVITHSALAVEHHRDGDGGTLRMVLLDELDRHPPEAETGDGDTGFPPAPWEVAYVIYTSGSTGRPKGVMVPHRAIVNRLRWMQAAYPLGLDDRVLQKTPVGFDVSVWELFWPLLTGACVVMARPGGHRDPTYLVDTVVREGITTMHFVPSMLQLFLAAPDVERAGTTLRRVVASGEALPADLVERFHARLPCPLHNLYGPTEAAVDVTHWTCRRDDRRGVIPIGRPIANVRTVVLAPRTGQPSPVGVPGELHLGGVNLARGYLGQPRRTALAFVPDPFAGRLPGTGAGDRLYATGDRVRWLPDGTLEFLGRLDHQVKIRGFRVELGEVEAALASHPAVREAVAMVRDEGQGARLVAWLVPDGEAPAVEALQHFLGERLPEAMVPAAFVVLDELPLNPSGKVDRKALPAPSAHRPDLEAEYQPPRTPTEEVLAAVFAQVLGIDRVGRKDTFFALGGDSLKSLRVVALAAERGVELTLQDLFRRQTLAELAVRVEGLEDTASRRSGTAGPDRADPGRVVPVPPFHGVSEAVRQRLPETVEDAYPLSRLQAGMVFESELAAGGALYHDHLALRLRGRFDRSTLRRALDEVAAAHPAVRTAFDLSAPARPLQRVHRRAPVPLVVVDLRDIPAAARERELKAAREQELARPFDFARPPLLRATVHRLQVDRWQLGLAFHHAVLDGLGFATFVAEVLARYAGLAAGAADLALPLPPPPAFRWFVAAEIRTLEDPDALDGWRRYLEGVEPSLLPPHPAAPADGETAPAGRMESRRVEVPEGASAAVLRLARNEALPVKSVLLALHLRVVAHLAGRRRPVTGVIIHNRPEAAGADRALGLFLNTLPLTLPIGGTWSDLAAAAFDAERTTLPLRLVPWPEIRRAVGPNDGLLFETVFNFAHFDVYDRLRELEGLEVVGSDFYEEAELALAANFSLGSAGRVLLTLEYRTDRLDGAQVEGIAQAYRRALEAFAEDPQAPVAAAPLLAPAVRRRLLETWGRSEEAGPAGTTTLPTLHGPVARQAAEGPERVALVDPEGRSWSYGELWSLAEMVARSVVARGVGPEDRVAVLSPRSAHQVAAVLGILRAGAAWVPLDPAQPEARLAGLVGDVGAALVVVPAELAERLPAEAPRLLFEELDRHRDAPLPPDAAGPHHLAYVFHTSGSTGRPKGVMVPHGAAAAAVAWRRRVLELGPEDRVLANIPPTFDPSVWQIFGPLGAGARLVQAPSGSEGDGALLLARIAGDGVTVLDLPPALFHELFVEAQRWSGEGDPLATLRTVFIGGQALPVEALERYLERLPVQWIDVYGPTEAVIEATAWKVRPGSGRRIVPVGSPTPGRTVVLLGPDREPVPPGTPGHLVVGGAGLARGYHGRPAATAEAFRPDPFSTVPGSRLYLTGDLARWLPEGILEFLGRADRQVKIGGLRIEPGEVEAVLGDHPEVREAVVEAREVRPGDVRLVVWVEPLADARPDPAALRGHLERRLPAGLVPVLWQVMAELPRTTTGKIDRRALPTPEAPVTAASTPPRTATERVVAEVWSEVLGVDGVGAEDDFFVLGGHSLAAVQAVARLRRALDVELPLEALFSAPTVAALAERLDRAAREAGAAPPPLERVDRSSPLPLSFAEERLWFLDRFHPDSPAYNIAVGLELVPGTEAGPLALALTTLQHRHEGLRSRYPEVAGEPVRRISAAAAPMARIDLAALPEERRRVAARDAAGQLARCPFDLARGPVFRPVLLSSGADRHRLLLVFHHVVTDGRSIEVLLAELEILDGAARRGRSAPLPVPQHGYADFAVWQRRWLQGEVLERQLDWWRRELAGLAPLELPTDRPYPAVRRRRGDWVGVGLDTGTTAALRRLGRRLGGTPFMVLLAGFTAFLGRLTHRANLAVGTPVTNRPLPEVADTVGLFVNTLVLRGDLSGDPGFEELVERSRATTLGAFRHQDLPFEKLVEELEPERDPSRHPLAQVVFVLQNAGATERRRGEAGGGAGAEDDGDASGTGLIASSFDVGTRTAKFDLTLSLGFETTAEGERLGGSLEYDADLFDPSTARTLARRLERFLAAAAEQPETPVARLPLLDPEEAAALAVGRLGPPAALAVEGEDTLDRLFRRHAAEGPDARALSYGPRNLTYAELDAAAERVARRLAALGAGPEVRVGLAAERGVELVVGLLGILRSGAAYVPLDPAVPAERLGWILADAGAELVAGTKEALGALPSHEARTVPLEDLVEGTVEVDAAGPLPAAGPDHLAYVLYTSGSTGRPKGVGVTHRQVVRLLDACQPLFGFGPEDAWTLFHSYAFDFSVWEIWGALGRGGRLVVVPHWISRSPGDFLALLSREGVTVLNQTPSAFKQLVQAEAARDEPAPLALRWVMFGGEALDLSSLAPWFARHRPLPRLVNMYGITETTVHVTWRPVPARDVDRAPASPVGGPLPHLRVHLLDRRGETVPPGVPGEIHVGGGSVSRGYPGQPVLTASRFVPDPFGPDGGGRLYASGDLARWVPWPGPPQEAGRGDEPAFELEYLGRIDQQVQLRGFRVEPAEIASHLLALPAVGAAVVIPRGQGDHLRLVAYLVAAGGDPGDLPPADELRAFLSGRLPDYMVPAAFVELDRLPLTPNGKLDRSALPEPADQRPELARGYEAPRTPVERRLTAILADVLGLDRVGIHDNFFDLGGQSLLAVKVVSRLRETFGVELPLQVLFSTPTVADMAYEIARRQAAEVDESALADLLDQVESLDLDEVARALLEEDGE